ncbi:MAG: class I SAM-dependent methyltransferase [Acidobacteria bacterium]|nr:class I SAM-dependent methyltransferase [Acidobacteriota bacterium]
MKRNVWLDIPAADYVRHMSSPEVDQLSALSRLLREALERFRPRDLLLLGCSTGNGLDQVDPAVTHRVTGVDINPEYLARVRAQFPNPGFELMLHCADVMTYAFVADAFDLVHCALLFEYLEWPALMREIGRTTRIGGGLSVVLQRPSDVAPAVTRTKYPSLLQLERLFRFVEPEAVVAHARTWGFELRSQQIEPLHSGKAFDVLHFQKGRGPALTAARRVEHL